MAFTSNVTDSPDALPNSMANEMLECVLVNDASFHTTEGPQSSLSAVHMYSDLKSRSGSLSSSSMVAESRGSDPGVVADNERS